MRAGAAPLADGPPATDPGELGYVPPVSTVRLPSAGLAYPPEHPLHAAETVDIKAMTAKEEDILSSPALMKKGTMFSTLIRSCLTNKRVDPDTLLVGDRNAILLAIRVAAYGPGYKVKLVCPSCAEEVEHEFDMSRLPIVPLDTATQTAQFTNEFSLELPTMRRRCTYKHMTGVDNAEMERTAERQKKARGPGAQEEGVSLRLLTQVTGIEDIAAERLSGVVRNMPARDSRLLRQAMDEGMPGVDLEQKFVCPACNAESTVEVPFGVEFFWPTL